jgi:hypothetical protein
MRMQSLDQRHDLKADDNDSQKDILFQYPVDVDIIREGDKRGDEFKRFMKMRGFRVDRYPYKVVTSWTDGKQHFFFRYLEIRSAEELSRDLFF